MFQRISQNFKSIRRNSDYSVLDANIRRQHVGIKCNTCGNKDFYGDRFCCTVCPNYNLCSECFCTDSCSKKHELSHPCLMLTYPPERTNPELLKLENLMEKYSEKDFNISCDHCEQRVLGEIYFEYF